MLDRTTRDSDAFLATGGECGRLIAERDWSDSLGPVESWPGSLHTATAILIASPVPMVMLWGADGIMIYNDAYSAFAGSRHPQLLGSKVREGWPEVADFHDHVMKVGLSGGTLQFRDQELTLHRNQGKPEQVWMDLDYSPVPGDDGEPAGVLAIVIDTSVRVQAERRIALRARLDDELPHATGPADIAQRATRLLSEHLGGMHIGFAEVEPERGQLHAVAGWGSGAMGNHVGQRRPISELGAHFAHLREGRIVAVGDTATDPQTRSRVEVYHELGIGAFLLIPVRHAGVLGGYFFAVDPAARDWTEEERSLMREVAERTWASMRRSRAELALHHSEDRYRTLFETIEVGFCIVEMKFGADGAAEDYKIVELNPAFERHTGLHGAHGRWVSELVPDLERHWHDIYGEVARTGTPVRFENGSVPMGERWFDVYAFPVDGTGSNKVGILFSDVSERREVEVQLRESEERFRNMADNTPVMMWVTDPTGYCTYLNKRWYEFTGQSRHEGEGLGWLNAVHPEDRPAAEKAFLAANEEQRDYSVEFRLRRADGTYRWTLDAAAARFDERARFMGYVGSVVDIDERREAEEATRNSEAMLRGVLEQIPVGVVLARVPGGEVMFQNEAADDILGDRMLPEDTGRYVRYGGIHEDGSGLRAEEYPLARTVSNRETVTDFPMRYRKPDGEIVFLEVSSGMLEDSPTSADLAICVFSDVTQRRRAEQHQCLLIDELSHRSKNLLAIIQSVAQQSFKGQREPAEMVSAFEGRLGALAAAHGILTRERWEAAPIRRVICDTITAVKSDDHRLVMDGPDLLLWPKTAVSLAMAVHELATNALKYGSLSNESGGVAIHWRVEDARLKLEWRERGGPPVAAPDRRGFGSRMIERGLAAELGGEVRIDFQPEGVVCTVDAPLPETRG